MNEQAYLDELKAIRAKNWPAGLPTEPQYPLGEKPLCEYLRTWAEKQPEKPAIQFYGYDLNFAELDKLSDQFANYLNSIGLKPGDGVALFMPNCPQFHIVYFGIMKAGCIHVPVSPLSKELELRHQLGDSQPKAAVCFEGLLAPLKTVCDELGIEHIMATSYAELTPENPTIPLVEFFNMPRVELPEGVIDLMPAIEAASADKPAHQPQLDDVFALNYTGGTTGLPKGCVHTNRNILGTVAAWQPVAFNDYSSEGSDQVLLNFLPEFWIAGENAGLLMPMFTGNTLVLMARWDAVTWMAAVQHYKVNTCIMLVDSIDDVLGRPELKDYDLTSINTAPCVSFIKKLNTDYRARWKEVTGGAILFETAYGMTETHTCDTFNNGFQDDNFDLGFAPAFVGMPVPGTEIKICDFESGELKPLDVEGEILIRTPTLLKGYWNKPEANAELFVGDGWFRTGDLGMVTSDGYVRYLGRRKEMIKVNGMSVFPTEVESMLGQNPAVAACGVIARPDEKKGQIPVAFVTLKPGHEETAESLTAWCKEAMAVFKVPEIRIMDALPMTATGKIKKNELDELL